MSVSGNARGSINKYPGGATIQPGDVLTLNADYVDDFVYPDLTDQ